LDHERTRQLIEGLPYSYLHVFPWSPREGTQAAELDGRVPRSIAAGRARELRELGMEKGLGYVASRVGELARVAVETKGFGLTGDYLRVKLCGEYADARSRTLVDVRLGSSADGGLRAGATGRAALPVLAAGSV
jgi:threonylcarbamoyladenosine tRNA methylthiotransferase MtaB